jgi:hypothetical protein
VIDPGTAGGQATVNSYDVAIFKVTSDPTIPVLNLNYNYVAPDFEARWVGFGCNLEEPEYEGTKQWANDTAASMGDATLANHLHNIRVVSAPVGCSGDSGGPFMARFTGNGFTALEAVGLTSFFLGSPTSGSTHFPRLSNVKQWIQNPHNVGTSIVAHNATGMLQNRLTTTGCVGLASSGGGAFEPDLYHCRGGGGAPGQPIDHQYWKLVATGAYYRIQNTLLTDKCLRFYNSGEVVIGLCTDTNTRWQFVPSVGGSFNIRPSGFPNSCLDYNTLLLPGNAFAHYPCDGTAGLDWYYYR